MVSKRRTMPMRATLIEDPAEREVAWPVLEAQFIFVVSTKRPQDAREVRIIRPAPR